MRKIVSVLLALGMVFGLCAPVWAEEAAPAIVASGECGAQGDNLTWTLDENGLLTISGTGEMENYAALTGNAAPWRSYGYKDPKVISVVIEKGVTSVGDGAFEDLSYLENVTLPDSITRISERAFTFCGRLTSIDVDEKNAVYDSQFGVLFNKAGTELIRYPAGKTDDHYTIPDGVTNISDYAFFECDDLKSIDIPDGVTSIGADAFSGCTSLTSITIPNGVTSIEVGTFSGCKSLTSITIPEGVTSIGGLAFWECESLTSITIPASVTSIGDGTAYGVFRGCSGLTSAGPIGSDGNMQFGWTEKIPDYAFAACDSLVSITIPDSVTSIGKSAFYFCESLKSVKLSASLTTIGDFAFSQCESLDNLEIPFGVTKIGADAFWNCSSLTRITLPDSVESFESYAFEGCSSLKNIKLSSSMATISSGAFKDCSSLTDIVIPARVKDIYVGAFENCNSLNEIYFEGHAPKFGERAIFQGVTATAYYPENDPTWTADVRQNYGGEITWVPYALPYTPGDLTGDGELDTRDLTALRKYLADPDSGEVSLEVADLNGDGVVDTRDYTRLRKQLAEIEDE